MTDPSNMSPEEKNARRYVAEKMRETADLLEAGHIRDFHLMIDNEMTTRRGTGPLVEHEFTGWRTVTIVLRGQDGEMPAIEASAVVKAVRRLPRL